LLIVLGLADIARLLLAELFKTGKSYVGIFYSSSISPKGFAYLLSGDFYRPAPPDG